MKLVMIIVALTALGAAPAAAQQTRYYDSRGSSLGTSSRDSQGTTTYRDSRGTTTGIASRDSQGSTTYRDSRGSVTGRSSR